MAGPTNAQIPPFSFDNQHLLMNEIEKYDQVCIPEGYRLRYLRIALIKFFLRLYLSDSQNHVFNFKVKLIVY